MKALLSLLIVALFAFCVLPASAQYVERVIMSANSFLPATAEFGPDGTATADSAWIVNTRRDVNSPITLIFCVDSIAGYDSVGVNIACYYETSSNYDNCIEATGTGHIVLQVDTVAVVIPGDTCYFETWTPPPHVRWRYRVDVPDTCSVTLTEITNNQVFHNPHR